jgi:hypothetical protein
MIRNILLFTSFCFVSPILAGPAPSNFEALHNTSRLKRFASTNEITAYFQTNSLSFQVLPMKRHADHYFWIASYPYSGLDTIDIYCFRGGPGGWHVQMLYFILSPKYRQVELQERENQFVVKEHGMELLTVAIQPAAEK